MAGSMAKDPDSFIFIKQKNPPDRRFCLSKRNVRDKGECGKLDGDDIGFRFCQSTVILLCVEPESNWTVYVIKAWKMGEIQTSLK